jgi:3D (Asp-Asp-Asp) domain-containing protein
MGKPYLLLLIFPFLPACTSVTSMVCEDNWQVTGYFVPVEKDYAVKSLKTIRTKGGLTKTFDSTFLTAVKLEGWGKTNEGWYLGFYSHQWHNSAHPLDALGKPLILSTIAADTNRIPFGREIYIPTLDSSIEQPFKVNDVGQAIKGKHIDIYTGEGKEAQLLTYKVTTKHQVCW